MTYTISDVTPEGFGPGKESASSCSLESPMLTVEQSRLRRSISEAQTILKGRMSKEKRAMIERSLESAQTKLAAVTSQEELDRQTFVRLATDAGY